MAVIKKSSTFEKGTIDLRQKVKPKSMPNIVENFEGEINNYPQQIESQEDASHIVEDAHAQSEEIIGTAHDEAQRILEDANASADQIKKKAYEEGILEGKKRGEDQITESINEAIETLSSAVKERRKIIKEAEPEMARLALKIAEHVIHKEVTIDKEIVMNIITEALVKMSDRENVIVRVSRDDAEYIKKYKDQISSKIDGIKNLSIMEDSFMEPGGCVIETNLGYIDARINTKLSLIEQAMKKVEKPSDSK